LWEAAVGRLIPLISTSEVQVIGRDANGVQTAIDGVIFAGISVGHPLRDHVIVGDNPWISCTPYVDDEHWGSYFNDYLYGLTFFGISRSSQTRARRRAAILRHPTNPADASAARNCYSAMIRSLRGKAFYRGLLKKDSSWADQLEASAKKVLEEFKFGVSWFTVKRRIIEPVLNKKQRAK